MENEGRICSGSALVGDLKGITSNVTLGTKNLTNWKHWGIPFPGFESLYRKYPEPKPVKTFQQKIPTLYWSKFQLREGSEPLDTFLSVDGWRKGVAYLNKFNLGRYWPVTGPQLTLYVPKHLLKPFPLFNDLVLFELEGSPCLTADKCTVRFVKTHVINGSTPYRTSDQIKSGSDLFFKQGETIE